MGDRPPAASELAGRLLERDERALARAISMVEDERPGFEELLDAVYPAVGKARRIGITGPPGAGKSTLTAELVRRYREEGHRVGVIAVDPTSPFTGGALLGDRVRMTEVATTPGVFVRSMASRGSTGGLATATREAADLMDACGFDRILLETLGVGQSELDVAGSADSTVVVLVPESGDGIQAMKAGLMEVADLFVVNKADRPGAERLENEIRVMMAIRRGTAWRGVPVHVAELDRQHTHHRPAPVGPEVPRDPGGERAGGGDAASDGNVAADPREWRPPVLRTVASTGRGIAELVREIDRHFAHLEASSELSERRKRARVERARGALLRRLRRAGEEHWEAGRSEWESVLAGGDVSPYRVAEAAWERFRCEHEVG